MTLAQAARQMEESGTMVKIGGFDTFADFISYFGYHYKPMLERWQQGDHDRLMGFFIDDMLAAFSESVVAAEAADIADPADTTPKDDPAQDVYAAYSQDMRQAVAYVNERLEPEDKAIIAAMVDKNFKRHLNPAYGIDEGKITDLLKEYGDDHNLGEGWWVGECDMDDIVLLINFEN